MKQVYISYDRKDLPFVERLIVGLNQNGINTWYAVQDVSPGASWSKEVDNALKTCEAVITILSKASVNSKWIQSEVLTSLKLGKELRIIELDGLNNAEYLFLEGYTFNRYPISRDSSARTFNSLVRHLINSLPGSLVSSSRVDTKKNRKNKGYVFLSYSEADSEFVDRLKDYLKNEQIAYWDYLDGERNYHTQFFLELESIIEGAVATLSILSPDWRDSTWSLKEFFFSEESGIPVYLLRHRPTRPTLAIAGIPYIDFHLDPDQGFTRLKSELHRKGL